MGLLRQDVWDIGYASNGKDMVLIAAAWYRHTEADQILLSPEGTLYFT